MVAVDDGDAVILAGIRAGRDAVSLFNFYMALPQPEGDGTDHNQCEEPVNHRYLILSASRAVMSRSDFCGTETKIGCFFGPRQGYRGSDFCRRRLDLNNILYS